MSATRGTQASGAAGVLGVPVPYAEHTPAYDVATLTTCDAEPIHVPGAIQPHGVLLALDDEQHVVVCSVNVETMLGVSTDEALGRPLAALVGSDLAARVAARRDEGHPSDPMVVVLGKPATGELGGQQVDVRVHASGDRVVVELESSPTRGLGAVGYRSARTAMTRLAAAASLPELTDLLAGEVRELTGFDRVMVYRFDAEWNGEVVAETRREDLNPFLGLHYPASDIPAQARRLYELNPIRLIADVGYVPVPLTPLLDPVTRDPLDLSHAGLRSVSPIHVEYLANMGVTASMSISILIDDQLWGLIACHHYSGAHRPGQEARSAAEFVTQVASHLVAHRERADARDAAVLTRGAMAHLAARLSGSDDDVLDALFADAALLDVFDATGAANMFQGTLRTRGVVPDRATLHAIADALNEPGSYLSSTDHLAALDARFAAVADIASGALRVGSVGEQWGLWFRPERRQVVDWGGDPTNKRLAAEEGADVRLSPRKSFEKWREVMSCHGVPWEPWHLEAAEELGRTINSLLLLRSREQIAMAESMQRSVVLDRAPEFAGVELTARYRPASTYQLGGDWWDAFELDERRLAFAVGDVAGHGVAAASAMTQVRTALRAYLYDGHPPGGCLDRLDRLMDGLLGVGVATALVAVLDRDTGLVEIASAGHPDPLLVRADGAAEELALERRPLLGVGTGTAPSATIDLSHGELLVLFTDGLVERRGSDTEVQTDRLLGLASGAGVAAVRADVSAWADLVLAELDTPDDDTTLLAVRLL